MFISSVKAAGKHPPPSPPASRSFLQRSCSKGAGGSRSKAWHTAQQSTQSWLPLESRTEPGPGAKASGCRRKAHAHVSRLPCLFLEVSSDGKCPTETVSHTFYIHIIRVFLGELSATYSKMVFASSSEVFIIRYFFLNECLYLNVSISVGG